MSDDFRDDLGSSDQEQSNQPTPAPLGVLQRTANAISPWVRRWWMGGASMARVPGQFPLASRVQRSVEFAAHPGGGGALIDRFSSGIVQRHATADQISRRYRIETRQPTSPAPSQLPLPGVTGASRVQRSPAEMSLEQLAHSFQTAPSVAGMDDQPFVQRAFDPALGSDTPQPSNLAELQDAARQAAQMRAAASVEGGAKTVQRTSESGTPSIAAMIGERIRQARERQAAQGMTSGTPSSAVPGAIPGAPSTPPIQRSPAAPMSTAAGSGLHNTGNSIAAAIEARIRQSRERLAAGNAPGSSAENSAEDSATSVSPASATPSNVQSSSIQFPQSPSPQSPIVQGAAQPSPPPVIPIQGLPATTTPDEIRRAAQVPGTEDSQPADFSVAAAIRERLQANRGKISSLVTGQPSQAASTSPTVMSSAVQRASDPESPNYSKVEVLRERMAAARSGNAPKPELSPNPGDANYSRAEQIRRRLEAKRIQRSPADVPAPAPNAEPLAQPDPAPPVQPSPAPLDPSQSIAKQIGERIQAARERQTSGTVSPTPASPAQVPTPIQGGTADAIRARIEAARAASAAARPGTSPGETVQRTPETRPPIIRDMRPQPSAPTSSGGRPAEPPQAKRMRALSRSQILTPERKTGNFLAGEEPKGRDSTTTAPTAVQRAMDVSPTRVASSETPIRQMSVDQPALLEPHSGEQSGEQRMADGPADGVVATSVQRTRAAGIEAMSSTPAVMPSEPIVQRSVETSALAVTPTPTAPRAPDSDTPSEPPVQQPVETSTADVIPTPVVTAVPASPVQRAPDEPAAATPMPHSAAPVEPPVQQPNEIIPPASPVVQRAQMDSASDEPTTQRMASINPAITPPSPVAQRTTMAADPAAEVPVPSKRVSTPPAESPVQRSAETVIPALTPAPPTAQSTVEDIDVAVSVPAAEISVLRTVEATIPAETPSPTQPTVQRIPVDGGAVDSMTDSATITELPIQRVVEATPLVETPAPAQPVVQRTPSDDGDVTDSITAIEPPVQQAVEATTPAEILTPAAQPTVQRTPIDSDDVTDPDDATGTPVASIPSESPVQRSVKSTTLPELPASLTVQHTLGDTTSTTPTSGSAASVEPPVQRAVETTTSRGATTPASPTVQRALEDTSSPAPAPESALPVEPIAQRSMERPTPAVTTASPPSAQRTPGDTAPKASAPGSATPIEPSVQPSSVQRVVETSPALTPVQRTPAEVDNAATAPLPVVPVEPSAQRSVETITPTPEAAPAASTPVEPLVQRTVNTTVPVETPASASPSVQRTSVQADNADPAPAARTPIAPPKPRAVETSISAATPVEADSETPAPAISTPVKPSVQRTADTSPVVTPASSIVQGFDRAASTPSSAMLTEPPAQQVMEAPAAETSASQPVQREVETTTPAVQPSVPQPLDVPVTEILTTETSTIETPPATSQTVQRTPMEKADAAASPASGGSVSTESVSSVPVEPPVQRLVASDPVTSTPAPHTPISQTVQRTPVEDVADAASPTPVMPVDSPMQRSVEAAPSIPTTAPLQTTDRKPTEHKPIEHKPTGDKGGSAPSSSQPADLPVQRMVETTPSAPSAPTSSSPAPVTPMPSILQRAAVDAGDETPTPTSVVPPAMPSGMASESPLQRIADEPSFHPINRHRDPRILARKVEPSRPVIQPDLALSRNEALAVLPQARVSSAPSVADVVQRTPVHTVQRLAVEAPVPKVSGPASIGPVPMTASPSIQRSPDETAVADRSVASERVRVQSVSPRSSSVIRRTPLTLAKLRASSSQSTVQREETEEVSRDSFLGASAGDGVRGSTEPQRMSGIAVQQSKSPVLQRNPSTPSGEDKGIEDESSEQNETRRQEAPNLDLIARAIVPLVKRMLTIERERRIYR